MSGTVPSAAPGSEARFTVGVRIRPVNGGGTLIVSPDAVVLETDGGTRALSGVQRIVHTDRHVALVRAWLVPPWFNTSVVVYDVAASGYAVTWFGVRGKLRDTLRAAGFQVQEINTVFSLRGGRALSRR